MYIINSCHFSQGNKGKGVAERVEIIFLNITAYLNRRHLLFEMNVTNAQILVLKLFISSYFMYISLILKWKKWIMVVYY